MKIGIANDHAGVDMKLEIINHLKQQGHEVINYGTDKTESYDYPIAGETLGKAVVNKEVDLGIAICGTGVGISLACNKVKGIRACCCSESVTAALSREHNNANIVCFGARVIGTLTALDIVDKFIQTPFSNGERHNKRIAMLMDIEKH